MKDKVCVAVVWPATTGKHYMYWAFTNKEGSTRVFGYSATQEESKRKAEELLKKL